MSNRVTLSESDVLSDFISLGCGKGVLSLTLNSSTVELWAKLKTQTAAQAKKIAIALQDGSYATSTSTDDVIEVIGGLDYAVKRTSGSGAVTVEGDLVTL